ncbi:MAG TPA: type II toxin-antitoxin system VapC family toxin [Mycobacterium sp.]|nr:type II toxin-antitoxin system VapC family toxin [Mycobacterium sp.]
MKTDRRAVADTSVLIGAAAGRVGDHLLSDYQLGVSTITLGELRLGVLQARDPVVAARRLSTYQLAQRFEPLVIDEAVSETWALLISQLRAAGRKAPINDTWIAATAMAHNVPVVSRDTDYDHMPDLEVIKI